MAMDTDRLRYPGKEGRGMYDVQERVVVEIHGGLGHDETGTTLPYRTGQDIIGQRKENNV